MQSSGGAGILQAVVQGNQQVGGHTEYLIELFEDDKPKSSTRRRFREFSDWHDELTQTTQPFRVPELPPKKFWGRMNPSFIEKRQQELQRYLDIVADGINGAGSRAARARESFLQFLGGMDRSTAASKKNNDGTNNNLSATSNTALGTQDNIGQFSPSGQNDDTAISPIEKELNRLRGIMNRFEKATINCNASCEAMMNRSSRLQEVSVNRAHNIIVESGFTNRLTKQPTTAVYTPGASVTACKDWSVSPYLPHLRSVESKLQFKLAENDVIIYTDDGMEDVQ